jgi:F-type H+-transporting ATPase subunit epsilon
MAKTFSLDIMTRDRIVYKGDVVSMVAPSEAGYFGVLADHAPIVASLAKGRITLRDVSGKTVEFDCAGKGFAEVISNKATLLLTKNK